MLGSGQPGRKAGSAPALVEVKQTICFNFILRQGLQEVSWNHSPCLSAQQHPATEESSRTTLGWPMPHTSALCAVLSLGADRASVPFQLLNYPLSTSDLISIFSFVIKHTGFLVSHLHRTAHSWASPASKH